ncbi:uncharacterized protein LOC134827322 [Culicoides brevitarsis]|uniref:uncharacterized protein LOC134827322 n=1 Tax=Culicoides brevitarsis TaxID=469753 RepID=UPI00307B472B
MKATLWMCSLLTTILFCTNNISAVPLRYPDSRYLEDNLLIPKRSKPSLSIVNPLDTLRQRIMLEMSRRQMREKEKQIEDNKALFRQIGKRGGFDPSAYYLEPLFSDFSSFEDNKRRQIDINTGQGSGDVARNVNGGRLPVYQQVLSSKNHNASATSKSSSNNNNNNDENDVLAAVNGLDANELDIPNDDYRLRYVYSMQQNRYN